MCPQALWVWWVYGLAVSILNQEYRLLLCFGFGSDVRKNGRGKSESRLGSLFWVLTMMDHDGVRVAYTYCYTLG